MVEFLGWLAGCLIGLYILTLIAGLGMFVYATHLGMKNFKK